MNIIKQLAAATLISAMTVSAALATPLSTISCPNLKAGTYKSGDTIQGSGGTWYLSVGQSGKLTLASDFDWPTYTDQNDEYSINDHYLHVPLCSYHSGSTSFTLSLKNGGGYACTDPGCIGFCETNSFTPGY